MNIHEYQAKELLGKFGVAVPKGHIAWTKEEAKEAANKLGGNLWVVKAQIHAGGRGKAGGVKLASSKEEVASIAEQMIGMNLVTHQTGSDGKEVQRVYVEEGVNIAKELYLSMLVDRATDRVTIIASTEGGMDIETVAKENPEKIISIDIDPIAGISPWHCRYITFALQLNKEQAKSTSKFLMAMYQAFISLDASMVEINPLVITKEETTIALDAKMNFDDNALFRQKEVQAMRDLSEEDESEVEASNWELNYVKLDGNIGCMVNGAGLAMTTMDIIKLYGGAPANFLDVGGGATQERVTAAFRIILSDPNVEAVLVNIFGGIMRCDVIASGIVAAAKEVALSVPLIVRLEGTNVDLGKKILDDSGLAIINASDLAQAASLAVDSIKEQA